METTLTEVPESSILLKEKTTSRRSSRKTKKSRYEGKKMDLQKFLNWEPEPDHFKYEWNDGIIESREPMMKNTDKRNPYLHLSQTHSSLFQ